jgi:hypothetical protein
MSFVSARDFLVSDDKFPTCCGGKPLKQVYSKNTLGALIDDNLCWNEQIDNISKKYQRALVCYAVQSHLFLLKLLNIFIKL